MYDTYNLLSNCVTFYKLVFLGPIITYKLIYDNDTNNNKIL